MQKYEYGSNVGEFEYFCDGDVAHTERVDDGELEEAENFEREEQVADEDGASDQAHAGDEDECSQEPHLNRTLLYCINM